MRALLFAGAVALSLAGVSSQAGAAVVQLTSPALLSSSDAKLVYSGQIGATINSPTTFSASGESLTFSTPGVFELDQAGYNYGGTAFPNGTNILFAGGFQGTPGPITIDFSTPVTEFGINAEDLNGGNYTVSFTPFDGTNALSTFTAVGNDPNLLSFEGARTSGGAEITSILISDNVGDNIGLGPVTFGNPPVSAAPEPSTWLLIMAGIGGIGVTMRWNKRERGSLAGAAVV